MKKRKTRRAHAAACAAWIAALLLFFAMALRNLERDRREESLSRLETAVRRAAVTCYAAEGAYPAELSVLQERYGLQIREDRFAVFYVPYADNIMPDITVTYR